MDAHRINFLQSLILLKDVSMLFMLAIEFFNLTPSSRHMLFAMACDHYLKVLSFCSSHFRIAAKIRLDMVSQINPQCNFGSQWIHVRGESGSNIDVFFGRRKSKTTEEWIKVRWMVPQVVPGLLERSVFFSCPLLLSKEMHSSGSPAACSRVLSWGSHARCKRQFLVSGRLWSFLSCSREPRAVERHSTPFPRKHGRSSFGDSQELQKELFSPGRVLWDASTAYHLKPGPGWHTSGKCEFPLLCRTGTPKKNRLAWRTQWKNWP